MPFLFAEAVTYDQHGYLARLRAAARAADLPLTHGEYFRICLSAHHATVATYVPTDVDNQIRFRLWHPGLPLATLQEMAETVVESQAWDWTPVSARGVRSPRDGERMSGHCGEWFSTAVAAYGALRRRDPDGAAAIAQRIARECDRELGIFEDCRRAKDGIGMMKAATVIAHNFGDLQRVLEMWHLGPGDPLADGFERTQQTPAHQVTAEINRRWMATENHRHFSLRGPRSLRSSADRLLPIGPFFDDWGAHLARQLAPEELAEVIEALIAGFHWLEDKAIGYCRALAGIEEAFPGGLNRLAAYLPARVARDWKTGALRTGCAVPRRRFEDQWRQMALNAGR